MKSKVLGLTSLAVVAVMLLSACSGIAALSQSTNPLNVAQAASSTTTGSTPSTSTVAQSTGSSSSGANSTSPATTIGSSDLLNQYQATLESIYSTVSPQVVNIMVLSPAAASSIQNFPGFGNNNNNNNNQTPQYSEALGSGFFWDTNGYIVTNNHVVDGATKIEVTLSDGSTYPATIVGQDPYSDLAVIKASVPTDKMHPVTLADSTQLKVGEIAIAIGNPYGFEGSMSVGNVSGLGRDLPSNQTDQTTGATYSIPEVIQTDASINPGNSGGVLVDINGQVIGVTSAIESNSGSSSGVGFAIPSEIVSKVVPSLISTGKYDHPYLGMSGTDMTPDIAQAMNLPSNTRGALVVTVTSGGPAEKAGLQPSNNTVTINGVQGTVGGDVITAIDGQTVNSMSDIIAYLAIHTQVGQTVTLSILRNGQSQNVQVTLGSRPSQ
jgi:S1-C subfamily serine protease